MSKSRKEKHFVKKPSYPGGNAGMSKFISSVLKYPEEAYKNNIQGTVVVYYEINQFGKVLRAKMVTGIGHGCDEEAVRVIKLLQFIVPKKQYKQKLKFTKKTNVHFKINKKEEVKEVMPAVQYNYQQEGDSGKSYSYKISV